MLPAAGLVSVIWGVTLLVFSIEAAPEPQNTQCCKCDSLMPTNTPAKQEPQVMPSPFKIQVLEDEYRGNNEVHVNLVATGGHTFRSFMLGAYSYPYMRNKSPVGRFTLLTGQDAYEIGQECLKKEGQPGAQTENFAVASRDTIPKTGLKFVWTANRMVGHIEFRATFVEDDNTYWVSEKSKVVQDPNAKPLPRSKHIPPISTSDCGVTKGCFREPAGCEEPQCQFLLTWKPEADKTSFELGGLANGAADRYVSFGISEDTYMGADTVFSCAHNSATETTEVYVSHNEMDPRKNVPFPKYDDVDEFNARSKYRFVDENEEGSYANARLRCRFTVNRDLDAFEQQLKPLRGEPQHLLFVNGYAKRGAPSRMKENWDDFPFASAGKVNLNEIGGDHSGRARYPRVKAHAILGILAWVLCASIGMIITKYYQTMWPNDKWCGQRFWVLGHFNCVSWVVLLTIIAVIIIFVEVGGYSDASELPQKAHPILGIIIFICILIIPIIALIRPANDSNCRPVYNWFYWLFTTIANVLAIPQMFIGMDFGKAMIPWWATWILVIWVIFHLICELTLEIHQCCTYKKNKDKKKHWEQKKRDYPKQNHPKPDPAGRRFKRFMLFLHAGFTILITLIMIIIIASA